MSATDDEDFVAYVTDRLPMLRRVAAQLAGDAHRGDDQSLSSRSRWPGRS